MDSSNLKSTQQLTRNDNQLKKITTFNDMKDKYSLCGIKRLSLKMPIGDKSPGFLLIANTFQRF